MFGRLCLDFNCYFQNEFLYLFIFQLFVCILGEHLKLLYDRYIECTVWFTAYPPKKQDE